MWRSTMETMSIQQAALVQLLRDQAEAQAERAREDATERRERAADEERRASTLAGKPPSKPHDNDALRDLKKELNYASLTAADDKAVKHDMSGPPRNQARFVAAVKVLLTQKCPSMATLFGLSLADYQARMYIDPRA